MTPLIIVKTKFTLSSKDRDAYMRTIADGIRAGALILSGDCEVIAFDSEGRLVYPVSEVTP